MGDQKVSASAFQLALLLDEILDVSIYQGALCDVSS